MHLIRHRYYGENIDSFFEFTMRNGDNVIEFTVDPSALNAMDGVTETDWDQRDTQFLRLRDRIEAVADRLFRDGPLPGHKAIALSVADF